MRCCWPRRARAEETTAWNLAPVQPATPAASGVLAAPVASSSPEGGIELLSRKGGGLLARAGLLAAAGFTPSDAPLPATPEPPQPARLRLRNDAAAIAKWSAFDLHVRQAHARALVAFSVTKGLKKPAIARAKELRARAVREEQTRQHAMSELLLQFGGDARIPAQCAPYADLCNRLVRNNLPHAGPLAPSKAMGVAFSEYLSAIDHHAVMTARCQVSG
ncbi:hypothetical protein T492DRAFT_1036368 [Pavlovales sp. CCMP2436]|nr:hypothetical protein T492DRAFT_1036368 [Pavlovales sp. CCMP2436]